MWLRLNSPLTTIERGGIPHPDGELGSATIAAMPEAAAASRFSLRRTSSQGPRFAQDVRTGLSAVKKAIPPQYFYDSLGSALFGAICELPEYYLTRAEAEILSRHRAEIVAALAAPTHLIELGSGSAAKTRLLLDELSGRELEYVPVDVDTSLLEQVGRDLIAEYPLLSVTAAAGDFRRPGRILRDLVRDTGQTAVLFLGSTIGNLDRAEAVSMLRDVRGILGAGAAMLIGADLRKAKPALDAAYNDALGVTAAFNLNLLQRINAELGGRFDLRCFAHRAFYDEERSRVEMHLVSLRDQNVLIDGLELEVSFHEGETIHTENSYKYDRDRIATMAADSGFRLEREWRDSKEQFGEFLLIAG